MTKISSKKYLSFSFFLFFFLVNAVKAGNFGEHKLIGDAAFKKYCTDHPEFGIILNLLLGSEPLDITSALIPLSSNKPPFNWRDMYAGQYPLLIIKGKAITYGDLTALSGDHFPDYIESYRKFSKDTIFGSSRVFFNKLFDDVLNQYDKELKNLDNGGTGYNPVFVDFIRLAARDKSHFHIPAMPLRQEIDIIGQKTYNQATDLLYSELTKNSFSEMNTKKMLLYFEANAVAKYSILHTIAKSYYIHALENFNHMRANLKKAANNPGAISLVRKLMRAAASQRRDAEKYLQLALFTNAFSDHYLQDMFAAGHFFADRNAPDFLGLEAKGIHDFFGRHGLDTQVEGNSVTLQGDGRYTPTQLNLAIEANYVSLQDLFNVDVTKPRAPEYDYLQLLRTPAEDPTRLFPALKKIPDVPLGKNFSSQRNLIGRSLSGLNYGLYALGSSKSYGGGFTTGFNYLAKTPDSSKSPFESYVGFGFNAFFETTADTWNNKKLEWQGRLGLGVNLFFLDWFYVNASIISSLPVAVRAKFEQGIQIKPLRWKYGIHIGIVEYTAKVTPSPAFTIGIIHY